MRIPPAKIHFTEADRQTILKDIDGILASGHLTLGEYGRTLEERFGAYLGVHHAVSVSSGTSALEILLRICGVKDKEVLVPTNTFFATPAAVVHAGGKPRFVDVEAETLSLSVRTLEKRVTATTVGVIFVEIAGIMTPEVLAVRDFCRRRGLFLIEDAAHAHGSSTDGRKAGTIGDAAAFSFYPTKVVTSGEGGMIVTNDRRVYDEALVYRDQGKAGFTVNYHTRLGYNWRMSEIHAAVGLTHFSHLDEVVAARNRIARAYDDGLRDVPGIDPVVVPAGSQSNYYKYVAMLDRAMDRDSFKKRLKQEFGVGLSGEVYEVPCHRQPVFTEYCDMAFPIADDVCRRHICLPIYETMSSDDVNYVLMALGDAVRRS